MKKDKTKQRELTEQREQRHACMTFVESRRKSIESSVRPVARFGRISAAAGATNRHQSGSDSVRKEVACPYDTYLSLVINIITQNDIQILQERVQQLIANVNSQLYGVNYSMIVVDEDGKLTDLGMPF